MVQLFNERLETVPNGAVFSILAQPFSPISPRPQLRGRATAG
jgi:hypothetical protein